MNMLEFSDFSRLSLNGDRPRKDSHRRYAIPEGVQSTEEDDNHRLRWSYTAASCIGLYELHARHDNGHRITTGCVPVYAQPSKKPVKDTLILELEKKLAKNKRKLLLVLQRSIA